MQIIENQILLGTKTGIKLNFHTDNKEPVLIRHCSIKGIDDPREDGIQILGPGFARVEDCFVDAKNCPPKGRDELASVVDGAEAIFDHCYFGNNGKGVLVGSGDTMAQDYASLRATFLNCVFDGNCRRNIYAQFGQTRMHRCWINNWGIPDTFHEKSNGAHAGKHGQLMLSHCVFTQRPFLECLDKNFLEDVTHQFSHWPYPGFMKAVYAEFGGQVKAYHCYKNRWWLRLANHTSPMGADEANELIQYLKENVVGAVDK